MCGCARGETTTGKSIDRFGNIVKADFWENYCGHYETYEMINKYHEWYSKREKDVGVLWRSENMQVYRNRKR